MKLNRDVLADVKGHYPQGLPLCKILQNIYYDKFCLISPIEWQFFARTGLGLKVYQLLQSGNLATVRLQKRVH